MLEVIIGYLGANYQDILSVFLDLFVLPFRDEDMGWIIIPLVVTILLMQFYYSKHKKEEPGWNTATANSLVLVFVAMDLFRFLSVRGALSFTDFGSYEFKASCFVVFVLLQGLTMLFMNFSHVWPKFIAFRASSHLTVNLIAYTAIVILYAVLPLSMITFTAVFLFLILMNVFFFLFRMLIP